MPTRTASAEWKGGLRGGTGSFKGQTGLAGSYNFGSRFQEEAGSNPEELLAAASSAPGTVATTVSFIVVILNPSPTFSTVQAALV